MTKLKQEIDDYLAEKGFVKVKKADLEWLFDELEWRLSEIDGDAVNKGIELREEYLKDIK